MDNKNHDLFAPKARDTIMERVYIIARVEAAQNNDLIQDTCFIKGKTINIIYYSYTTHLFISYDCVQCLDYCESPL